MSALLALLACRSEPDAAGERPADCAASTWYTDSDGDVSVTTRSRAIAAKPSTERSLRVGRDDLWLGAHNYWIDPYGGGGGAFLLTSTL